MQKFDAKIFLLTGSIIEYEKIRFNSSYEPTADEIANTQGTFRSMKSFSVKYNLSATLSSITNAEDFFKNFKPIRGAHVTLKQTELLTALGFDLEREAFFYMPATHAARFRATQPFGVDVARNYPSIEFDASEAGSCFACGRYTASVYHSMRVLEYGLRAFRAKFPALAKVTNPNWGEMLNDIKAHVIALPNSNADKKGYLELLTDFQILKDAWRNSVSHVGTTYDETQADTIYRHVKHFMAGLTKLGIKE